MSPSPTSPPGHVLDTERFFRVALWMLAFEQRHRHPASVGEIMQGLGVHRATAFRYRRAWASARGLV